MSPRHARILSEAEGRVAAEEEQRNHKLPGLRLTTQRQPPGPAGVARSEATTSRHQAQGPPLTVACACEEGTEDLPRASSHHLAPLHNHHQQQQQQQPDAEVLETNENSSGGHDPCESPAVSSITPREDGPTSASVGPAQGGPSSRRSVVHVRKTSRGGIVDVPYPVGLPFQRDSLLPTARSLPPSGHSQGLGQHGQPLGQGQGQGHGLQGHQGHQGQGQVRAAQTSQPAQKSEEVPEVPASDHHHHHHHTAVDAATTTTTTTAKSGRPEQATTTPRDPAAAEQTAPGYSATGGGTQPSSPPHPLVTASTPSAIPR